MKRKLSNCFSSSSLKKQLLNNNNYPIPKILSFLFNYIISLKDFYYLLEKQYNYSFNSSLLLNNNDFNIFLSSTFIIFPYNQCFFGSYPALPTDKSKISFNQDESLKDIIHRAINFCLSQSKTSLYNKNIITYGFKIESEVSNGGCLLNTCLPIECYFPNTSLHIIKEQEWIHFHHIIGDYFFYFLLVQCLIFIPSSDNNNNYIQCCGIPLSEYIKDKNISTPLKDYPLPKSFIIHNKINNTSNTKISNTKISLNNNNIIHKNKTTNQYIHSINWYSIYPTRFLIFYNNPKAIRPKIFIQNHWLNQYPSKDNAFLFYYQLFKDRNTLYYMNIPDINIKNIIIKRHMKHLNSHINTLIDLLQRAMKYHQKRISYNLLLKHYCNLDTNAEEAILLAKRLSSYNNIGYEKIDYNLFTKYYTSYTQISQFIMSIIKKLFYPLQVLLGSDYNIRILQSKIYLFISLKRRDNISIGYILEGIKISHFKWLSSKQGGKTQQEYKKRLIGRLFHWLFRHIIIPLISNFFYCTESAVYFNKIFYFRKPLWSAIHTLACNQLIQSKFEYLSKHQVNNILLKRSFRFSSIRMLPKNRGIRPILNLGKKVLVNNPQNPKYSLYKSINSTMKNIFHIISYEIEQNNNILNCSVLGLQDIYRSLIPFYNTYKLKHYNKKLYFVSLDLKGCFDNINHNKLLQSINNIFKSNEYIIRRFIKIMASHGVIRTNYIKKATSINEYLSFKDFCDKKLSNKDRNSILIDQVVYQFENKDDILVLLKEHILNNIIKYEKSYYRQNIGIPQGSILSTLLCSLHYATFDNEILSSQIPLDNNGNDIGVLMRLIDDFLYITTSEYHAKEFLNIMSKPNSEFGFIVNTSKTKTNFNINSSKYISWCGLLIDTNTLELSPDYSRYYNSYISNTITNIGTSEHAGNRLRRLLIQHLKPKCHILLLDEQINSRNTVLYNIYKIVCFVAIKFISYSNSLSHLNNIQFLWSTVKDICSSIKHFVIVKVTSLESKYYNCKSSITSNEILWISYKAFLIILQRKQTKFRKLITLIQLELSKPYFSSLKLYSIINNEKQMEFIDQIIF